MLLQNLNSARDFVIDYRVIDVVLGDACIGEMFSSAKGTNLRFSNIV
jgi:hypothetical protein